MDDLPCGCVASGTCRLTATLCRRLMTSRYRAPVRRVVHSALDTTTAVIIPLAARFARPCSLMSPRHIERVHGDVAAAVQKIEEGGGRAGHGDRERVRRCRIEA